MKFKFKKDMWVTHPEHGEGYIQRIDERDENHVRLIVGFRTGAN